MWDRLLNRHLLTVKNDHSGVTAIVIVFFLHTASMGNPFKTNGFWGLLWSLDPLGFVLFVPSIVSILIALQVSVINFSLMDTICKIVDTNSGFL